MACLFCFYSSWQETAASQWNSCAAFWIVGVIQRFAVLPVGKPGYIETCLALQGQLTLILIKASTNLWCTSRSTLLHTCEVTTVYFSVGVQQGLPFWAFHLQHATAQTTTFGSWTGYICNIVIPFPLISDFLITTWVCPESNTVVLRITDTFTAGAFFELIILG